MRVEAYSVNKYRRILNKTKLKLSKHILIIIILTMATSATGRLSGFHGIRKIIVLFVLIQSESGNLFQIRFRIIKSPNLWSDFIVVTQHLD